MRNEDKAGLQLTIIIHLVVLIILLVVSIGAQLRKEDSFVLDFTREEQIERQQQQEAFEESIKDKIDRAIASSEVSTPIRNVAVSSRLRDDRMSAKEADELYNDVRRLSNDLKAGYKSDIEEDAIDETVDTKPQAVDIGRQYSGPSVLSWVLDGRKASHLPIPAYRCYEAGKVVVIIIVDPHGNVVNARIDEAQSSSDECLRSGAIRAARLSKFSKSTTAPSRQPGEITYSFIAQHSAR